MARGPLDFWINWASQIGVVSSLVFQVILHLFANARRRSNSIKLRVPLWLAYQLADTTATYAAGQLLHSSSTPQDQQLIAFWAPFLLLHLGGPDNITAYALEDSKLWTRHLLSLVVQVLGATYVLYEHVIGSGILLTLAAFLIFGVGVAKYAERTFALWFTTSSSIRRSLKVLARDKHHKHFYIQHQDWYTDLEDEFILQRAHSMFHICKRGIVDSVIEVDSDSPSEGDSGERKAIRGLIKDEELMWRVMEMELSLMYDILYTKASVIHCLVGYCIRVISPLAVVASLVLFLLSGTSGYRRVDVYITYILLGVALILETKSLLGALGSSWALGFLSATRCDWLRHSALCNGRWHRLRRALVSFRGSWPGKMLMKGNSRRWSGTMGQHNMVRFHSGQVDPMSQPLGNLCNMLILEWWDRRHYSWTIDVPEKVKKHAQQEVNWMVLPAQINTMGLLRHQWGGRALNNDDYPGLLKELDDYHGVDFHESVMSWHIATDLILADEDPRVRHAPDDHVEVVSVVSNYMMFLLVDSPDMLPGLPQNWLYEQTCKNLNKICTKHMATSPGNSVCTVLKNLFRPHHQRGWEPSKVEKKIAIDILRELQPANYENPRLSYAGAIAKTLLRRNEDPVETLLKLWMDFLTYAANRCSREAHARKLSTGGELLTVLWLCIEHVHQVKEGVKKRQSLV